MSNSIVVNQLSKQYRLGELHRSQHSFREMLMQLMKRPFKRSDSTGDNASLSNKKTESVEGDLFWALDDLSFTIPTGQITGVIGRNGAGKSTLLKVLSRITPPTQGEVRIAGRVASLLEVGTGFHPELTGRENIYMNASILGMKRHEVHRKLDDIVAFAEVEQFLDTPVKRYSSGMYVRLAFSVAAHLDADVLMVDEVLAVGDAKFQQRCIRKMSEVGQQNKTVLFVSHNMGLMSQLCSHIIYLEQGKLHSYGESNEIISQYLSNNDASTKTWIANDQNSSLQKITLATEKNAQASHFEYDESARVVIEFCPRYASNDYVLELHLIDMLGHNLLVSFDADSLLKRDTKIGQLYRAQCHLPSGLLRPGRYQIKVIFRGLKHSFTDKVEEADFEFEVSEVGMSIKPRNTGIVLPVLQWECEAL